MKLRDLLEVCSGPVIVEKFDECGNGTSYELRGSGDLDREIDTAVLLGEEYGLTGYEDIYEISIDDGIMTATLCDPDPEY